MMNSQAIDFRAWLPVLALMVMGAPFAHGQEAEPPAFLHDARKYDIESGPERTRLVLREQSLLNWTNPIRQQERGALYVWLRGERPEAIGTLFTYQYNETVYFKHEFHSLTVMPLKATFEKQLAWTPDRPGVVWHDLPDSPQPAALHVGRALQMRQLARGFRAELIDPKGERTELRLASRPLYEYAAPNAGILDGAILSFVVATDPEVLLLIEAFDETRSGQRATGFRYAFARFHYWQLRVFRDDAVVWEAPLDKTHEQNNLGDRGNLTKSYNSFHPRPGVKSSSASAKP
jgi:hypothetical protein